MLEKPDLPDDKITAVLRNDYGVIVTDLTFLPLGADLNTVVYRVTTADNTPYFVKLRRGTFNGTTVEIPKFLHDHSIPSVLAALPTLSGTLWTPLEDFALILYPFVEGHNGFEVDLAEQHWTMLGKALKAMHTTTLPLALASRLPQEQFSTRWCGVVKQAQASIASAPSQDPLILQLAALLQEKQASIHRLIERTEHFAALLNPHSLPFVLCHADIHVGNILLDTHSVLHIIDWDEIKLAPKERDLMYIGAGIGGPWPNDEARFYQGYGPTTIDPVAFAYYRYSRIVEDIGISCEEILSSENEGENRKYALRLLANQFLPGGVVDIAFQSENYHPPLHQDP